MQQGFGDGKRKLILIVPIQMVQFAKLIIIMYLELKLIHK
jgi:hypothetical protein